jgi:membrane protein
VARSATADRDRGRRGDESRGRQVDEGRGRQGEEARGRHAERPRQIPKAGWRDILLRTWNEMGDDHVSMIAAGVAFYGLLAIFPAIAAIISIWGLLADPQQLEQQIEQLSSNLPQAGSIISDQARKIASNAGAGVSFAAVGGILFALYSASKGMKALIEGLNIIYDEDEKRGFFKLNLMALGLTLGMIVVLIVSLALIMAAPTLLGSLGLGSTVQTLVTWLRWPVLFLVVVVSLGFLYRFAPSRDEPQWHWVSWGAALATVVWLIGSIAFSIYVRNFGSYNETYGSLGAVVILLMWFWLSALIVLMGAELNAEMEHQTKRDTTEGRPRPMGERGAHAADTVGQKP